MNSIKALCLLIGLSISLSACQAQSPTNFTIISGKVDVQWSNTIKLSNGAVSLVDPWIDRLNVGDEIIKLEPDGSFEIKLQLEKPDFYTLSHQSNQVELFVSPNDSLYIDFNSETVVTGTGEKVNTHLRSLRGIINSNRRFIDGIDFL